MASLSPPRLILASTSPRRRELLGALGFKFEIVASRYEEADAPPAGMSPADWVVDLAAGKAREVASRTTSDALVIGADTTVAIDEHVLSKPTDPADAARMLRLLSGRTHQVYTGICVIQVLNGSIAEIHTDYERTDVTFAEIADDVIAAYVATGEPLDKAGAYGIQGKALAFIPRIDGDYFNVVGLPLYKLCGVLEGYGVGVW
jgi:septum formation protein